MKSNYSFYWKLCIWSMIALSIVVFSPLVIPAGEYEPMVFGLPRTLWAGILVYIAMVIVTFIGTRVHPNSEKTKGDTE